MNVHDLPTPALIIDTEALDHNLATMAAVHPRSALRPHVKAHKCTALAARQQSHGHHHFTCATPAELLGMVAAGVGDDLLLANEVLDPARLRALAAVPERVTVTIAVDSPATIDAAADAGVRHVLIDVNIGLPRCGCDPSAAGELADRARNAGLDVRGVMGYEGHLMVMADRAEQASKVDQAVEALLAAHAVVGGDIVSGGGTGTYDLHSHLTEVQAGSYALMDSYYATMGLPFRQACWVLGTVISTTTRHCVADVGLKALAMDHGNPTIDGAQTWFLSDEHITFSGLAQAVGDRVRVVPAHIDPTMAMHDTAWLVSDDEVVDRWSIDLRGW